MVRYSASFCLWDRYYRTSTFFQHPQKWTLLMTSNFTIYPVIFLLLLLHFLFTMADMMANVSYGTSRLRCSLCFTLMALTMKLYQNFSVRKDNHLSRSTTTVIQKLMQRMSVISHIQQIICEPSYQQQECSLEKYSSRSEKLQKWKTCQGSPHTKIERQVASAKV